MYTNRYQPFERDGKQVTPSYVKLPEKGSDTFATYKIGRVRLDKISEEKYGNPYHGWLIMLGNPQYATEYDIPDNALLRVPFPMDLSVREYERQVKLNKRLYG